MALNHYVEDRKQIEVTLDCPTCHAEVDVVVSFRRDYDYKHGYQYTDDRFVSVNQYQDSDTPCLCERGGDDWLQLALDQLQSDAERRNEQVVN